MGRRLAIALVLPLVLAGCSGLGTRETVHVTSTQWVDPESGEVVENAEPAAVDGAWKQEYEWVLDHPGNYPIDPDFPFSPDGVYSYALVEANGGGAPELLLASLDGHTNAILLFSIGADGKAHPSSQLLIDGTPGDGAAREAVHASAGGTGIYQVSGSSRSLQHNSRHYVLNGTSLESAGDTEVDIMGELPDHLGVEWVPVSDKQPLHDGTLTVSHLSTPDGSENPDEVGDGQVAYEGTVRKYTGGELTASIGSMPNGEDPSSEYFVLDLDSPQMVRGRTAPGYKTEEVERFKLGKRERSQRGALYEDGLEFEQYVGKRLRVLVDEGDVNFPTDTSMPLGVPGFGASMVFEVLN